MSTFQTLISLVLLIYILSVIVQAIQEFIKTVSSTKAAVMEKTIDKFMGDSLPLSEVKQALEGRGLNLTALENFDRDDFGHLLDGIDFNEGNLKDIVKPAGPTVDQIKDNIAGSYEAFRTTFQQAYTKRNKLFVFGISFLVVFVLNTNLIPLYEQISADQSVRQVLVNKATLLQAAQPPKNSEGQSPGDLVATVQNTRDAITKDLQDYPILLRTLKFGDDHKHHPYTQFAGLLIMGLLVSLGAPFWNDVLKGMTGMNNALNRNGKKAS